MDAPCGAIRAFCFGGTFYVVEYPIFSIAPDAFPPLLSEIHDPPQKLFVRGTLPSYEYKWLSVVGSRNCSPYGNAMCKKLISDLRGYPVVIVSGLALGIDGCAHEAALAAGLATVAVPGSGLNDSVIYPATHRTLAHNILAHGGALVSEFEPLFKAAAWGFPKRNRIMAGLSHAVLVIEATPKSGTLITARLALDYNRDVFALPGLVTSDLAAGPHQLIRDGAALIRNTDDILEALSIDAPQATASTVSLTPEESLLLNLLVYPTAIDELIRSVSLAPSAVNTLVSMMELKGFIVEIDGKLHKKI
jgi:DNA processing protein